MEGKQTKFQIELVGGESNLNGNVDVLVRLQSGGQYSATFFTTSNEFLNLV